MYPISYSSFSSSQIFDIVKETSLLGHDSPQLSALQIETKIYYQE